MTKKPKHYTTGILAYTRIFNGISPMELSGVLHSIVSIRYTSIASPITQETMNAHVRERNIMTQEIPGSLHVANDVLADIVGNAALECYGVVGMAAPTAADGIAKILPASRLRRGVTVTTTEQGVRVELYVVIEYGTNINAVSQNLIDQVTFALTESARVPIDSVDVHVQGIKVRK